MRSRPPSFPYTDFSRFLFHSLFFFFFYPSDRGCTSVAPLSPFECHHRICTRPWRGLQGQPLLTALVLCYMYVYDKVLMSMTFNRLDIFLLNSIRPTSLFRFGSGTGPLGFVSITGIHILFALGLMKALTNFNPGRKKNCREKLLMFFFGPILRRRLGLERKHAPPAMLDSPERNVGNDVRRKESGTRRRFRRKTVAEGKEREKKKETKEKSNVYSTWIYTGSDGSPSVTKSGLSRVPLESYNTQQEAIGSKQSMETFLSYT